MASERQLHFLNPTTNTEKTKMENSYYDPTNNLWSLWKPFPFNAQKYKKVYFSKEMAGIQWKWSLFEAVIFHWTSGATDSERPVFF